jgi:hypothetical protein
MALDYCNDDIEGPRDVTWSSMMDRLYFPYNIETTNTSTSFLTPTSAKDSEDYLGFNI